MGAGRGAVARPAIREKGAAAHRAGPQLRAWALPCEGGLQRRVKGQDGLPEIAAIGTRPAFPQHIAGAVQR